MYYSRKFTLKLILRQDRNRDIVRDPHQKSLVCYNYIYCLNIYFLSSHYNINLSIIFTAHRMRYNHPLPFAKHISEEAAYYS